MGTKKTTEKNVTALQEVETAMFKSVDDYVQRFGERFSAGLNAIAEAGRIYAEALRKHPTLAQEQFRQKYPTVSDRTWNMLRAIGNGDLNPGAMILLPSVADKVKKLPREQQDVLFRESSSGVWVMNPRNYKFENVDLANMTSGQLSIALDEAKGKLRNEREQREFVSKMVHNCRRENKGRAKTPPVYKILGRTLMVGNVEIGIAELKSIIAQMERS